MKNKKKIQKPYWNSLSWKQFRLVYQPKIPNQKIKIWLLEDPILTYKTVLS